MRLCACRHPSSREAETELSTGAWLPLPGARSLQGQVEAVTRSHRDSPGPGRSLQLKPSFPRRDPLPPCEEFPPALWALLGVTECISSVLVCTLCPGLSQAQTLPLSLPLIDLSSNSQLQCPFSIFDSLTQREVR